MVPERRAGDAPREFADGVDERGYLRGVSGCRDLLWADGETAWARERAAATGVGFARDRVAGSRVYGAAARLLTLNR